jgi:hypothetical protein
LGGARSQKHQKHSSAAAIQPSLGKQPQKTPENASKRLKIRMENDGECLHVAPAVTWNSAPKSINSNGKSGDLVIYQGI